MNNALNNTSEYMEKWCDLRNAIIETAISDYKLIIAGKMSRRENCNVFEIEKFFKSDYCENLLTDTGMTGEEILQELHKFRDEYYESLAKKKKKGRKKNEQ